ncbi:hypothetical protein EHS13_07070 [Paenibacillus psychroresistens]|uniref:Uncharacterized protein n=1 Tax=Paenibacillus psychroresistens TaxID=1778678 RepID=A0A6B8RH05_9BACL|nr:hypothetical protein [Paenibacillus psychroresistens]QGQ94666.1 hypothetical protein EHS13_07070 [Paenibacillus psychroresistens]
MQEQQSLVVVSAPNKAGKSFIHLLMVLEIPFAVLVNSTREYKRMKELGIINIMQINTFDHYEWLKPEFPVGNIYLFERSLPLCCRYLLMCRKWTKSPIRIISNGLMPRMIYRVLGANEIIVNPNENVTFLMDSLHDFGCIGNSKA